METKRVKELFKGNFAILLELFTQSPNILAVFLFGSQVDGNKTPDSDIDLAVLYKQTPSLEEELDFSAAVADVLHTDKVDVLCLNRAGLILRHRAISGILLYESDAVAVSDFLEDTIRYYVDYLPDLQQYYRDYDRALEEAYGIRPDKIA